MRRPRALALIALLCIVLAACGGDDGASEDTAQSDTGSTATEGSATSDADAGADQDQDDSQGAAVTDDLHGVTVTGDEGEAPQIELPDGDPPTELVIVDLIDGDGPAATPSSMVTTHYAGVSWVNGDQFDSSWERGEAATFPLSGVIQGWQEGIPGMRVGGRRMLIIPPEMAYGSSPPPGAPIAPDDTLVFVIDLQGLG